MKRNLVRMLLVANVVLLIVVVYIGSRVVQSRADALALDKVTNLCKEINQLVIIDAAPLEEAALRVKAALEADGHQADFRMSRTGDDIRITSMGPLFRSKALEPEDVKEVTVSCAGVTS